MLVATDVYFKKLVRNLNGIIEALGPPRPKTGSAASKNLGRDLFWSDLLAIWCKIGGEETGGDAADFLMRGIDPGLQRHAARHTGRRPYAGSGHSMAVA